MIYSIVSSFHLYVRLPKGMSNLYDLPATGSELLVNACWVPMVTRVSTGGHCSLEGTSRLKALNTSFEKHCRHQVPRCSNLVV